MSRVVPIVCVCTVFLACAGCPHATAPSFRVSSIPFSGGEWYPPSALNNHGDVVGYAFGETGAWGPAIWRGDKPALLDEDGESAYATGYLAVTDSGAVVTGGESSEGDSLLLRWMDGEVSSDPVDSSIYHPIVYGINESLAVVGEGRGDPETGAALPFLCDASVFPAAVTPLSLPESAQGVAVDVNESNTAVGLARVPQEDGEDLRTVPYMWKDGDGIELLRFLTNRAGQATAINDFDVTVGTFVDSPEAGWVWRNGYLNELELAGASSTHAADINNAGWIVGSATFPNGAQKAVLWRPSDVWGRYGAQLLEESVRGVSPISITAAYSINDQNEILAAMGATPFDKPVLLRPCASGRARR